MQDQNEILFFESDEYIGYSGYIGVINKDWNVCGIGHESGLKLMSLKKGDVVALSFPLARNRSDDVAQAFSEEQY